MEKKMEKKMGKKMGKKNVFYNNIRSKLEVVVNRKESPKYVYNVKK